MTNAERASGTKTSSGAPRSGTRSAAALRYAAIAAFVGVFAAGAVSACAESDPIASQGTSTTAAGPGSGGSGGAGGSTSSTLSTGTDTSNTSSANGGGGGASGVGGGSGGAGGSGSSVGGSGMGGAGGSGSSVGGGGAGGGTGGAGGAIPCDQNPEQCNGLDDNCNNQTDEGDPGGGAACVANAFGVCTLGVQHCKQGAVKCVAGQPTPEICDGLDNNCDSFVDEGNPGGGMQCNTGLMGLCATGVTQCTGAMGVVCMPSVTPGQLMESCNGLDDDCDGLVDNNVGQVGQACTANGFLGQCQFGTYVCPNAPPFQLTCNHPLPGTVPEVCNNKDDDCNGTIDDPALVNGGACQTGLPGQCANGKTQCVQGSGSCVPNIAPGSMSESCNNVDDDCNGAVDDIPNVSAACQAQNPNAAHVQSWACSMASCQITMCGSGYADIDTAPGNGCECVTDAWSNTCGGAGALAVPPGNPTSMVGKIESAAGSDFVIFNFADKPSPGLFHPLIQLTDSGGGQYAMDVLADCNSLAACAPDGANNVENGAAITLWQQDFNYLNGGGYSDNWAHQTSLIVRIYRKFGDAPTCTSYTVQATNN